MAYQAIFKRFELKYILTLEQKEKILDAIAPYMELDEYGRTTIRNIYFDTPDYRLIRESIEKPIYKEKLRVRSYEQATDDSKVFVEIKKKYDHIVYKRRISLPENKAMNWLCQRQKPTDLKKAQIANEIEYFLDFYENLQPAVFLTYEREAFYTKQKSDFRVTFDDTVLFRQDDISLKSEVYGQPLLDDGKVLMEVKCSTGIPLWFVETLSNEKIYKTSFSKYGTGYTRFILPKLNKNALNTQEKKYAKLT